MAPYIEFIVWIKPIDGNYGRMKIANFMETGVPQVVISGNHNPKAYTDACIIYKICYISYIMKSTLPSEFFWILNSNGNWYVHDIRIQRFNGNPEDIE